MSTDARLPVFGAEVLRWVGAPLLIPTGSDRRPMLVTDPEGQISSLQPSDASSRSSSARLRREEVVASSGPSRHLRPMAGGSYFLVYFDRPFDLSSAERELGKIGWLETTRTDETLSTRPTPLRKNGEPRSLRPLLAIGLSEAAHVKLEALETAERHDAAELARCDRRFEVGFDDLAAVLDETNTLIEVQAALQTLTSGYVVNAWNGVVQLPDGRPCECARCRR